MSKQRVINESNLSTCRLVNSLLRGYGTAINNKVRYEISDGGVEDKITDMLILKGLLDTDYCYLEDGDDRVTREMIISEHAENIKEL